LLKNFFYIRKCVRMREADIYHITGDIHYCVFAIPRKKCVLTIHDLMGLVLSHNIFKRIFLYLIWYVLPTLYCKHIVAISEKTKSDLIKYCPWVRRKISVIADPIGPEFICCEKKFNVKKPNILIVGTAERKNLIRLIEAVNELECQLTIVGRIPELEKEKLVDYNIEYRNMYDVSDSELINQYRNADIVFFASLYEGFGMITIEAQSIGRVVLTSNIEPHISIAGKGACFVDPYSIVEIKNGIKKLIENERYREGLIAEGLKNAQKYTVANIANQYIGLYFKMNNI